MKKYEIISRKNNNNYASFELNDKDYENVIEIKKQFINEALLEWKILDSFIKDNWEEIIVEFDNFLNKIASLLKNGWVQENLNNLNTLFENFFDKYFDIKELDK